MRMSRSIISVKSRQCGDGRQLFNLDRRLKLYWREAWTSHPKFSTWMDYSLQACQRRSVWMRKRISFKSGFS